MLSYLLNRASHSKHLTYAEWREYRRNWVIPSIQETRGLIHSSSDCDAARQAVGLVIEEWAVPNQITGIRSAAAETVGTPNDGTLPSAPVLGATRSDTLK